MSSGSPATVLFLTAFTPWRLAVSSLRPTWATRAGSTLTTPAALERAEAMIRVFGDALGEEPGAGAPPVIHPESVEFYAPSWVRAAKPYNEDHFAIADGSRDVLRMMSNESPFAPSPRVMSAILEAAMQGNRYPTGGRDLKERLAEREGLSAENAILGAGSTELIDVIVRSFVSPGEEVVLSVPTFSMYESAHARHRWPPRARQHDRGWRTRRRANHRICDGTDEVDLRVHPEQPDRHPHRGK